MAIEHLLPCGVVVQSLEPPLDYIHLRRAPLRTPIGLAVVCRCELYMNPRAAEASINPEICCLHCLVWDRLLKYGLGYVLADGPWCSEHRRTRECDNRKRCARQSCVLNYLPHDIALLFLVR